MTTGPAATTTATTGQRVYPHPVTGEQFVSVTSCLEIIDKPALKVWAARLAAQAALDNLPWLINTTMKPPCGNTGNRCSHHWQERCPRCPCKDCPTCAVWWLTNRHNDRSEQRKHEGSEVHDVIRQWILDDGFIRPHTVDAAPYVAQFLQWVADYGLTPDSWEMTEATVINRTHNYAGTLDTIVTVRPTTDLAAGLCADHGVDELHLLVDYKTRDREEDEITPKVYPEHGLQLAAYARGEAVMLPDGTELPMPTIHAAAVLQLRPHGYTLRPTRNHEDAFDAFLLAGGLAEWMATESTAEVSPLAAPQHRRAVLAAGRARKAVSVAGVDVDASAKSSKPAKATKTTKATAKRAPAKKTSGQPKQPSLPDSLNIAEVGRRQSATLASMRTPTAAPPSDDIPF